MLFAYPGAEVEDFSHRTCLTNIDKRRNINKRIAISTPLRLETDDSERFDFFLIIKNFCFAYHNCLKTYSDTAGQTNRRRHEQLLI